MQLLGAGVRCRLYEIYRKKEFEQSRKLKHLSVRSAAAMLAGNKREKIAESEQRYHAAFETEQNCKRQIEQLSIELGTMSEKARLGIFLTLSCRK